MKNTAGIDLLDRYVLALGGVLLFVGVATWLMSEKTSSVICMIASVMYSIATVSGQRGIKKDDFTVRRLCYMQIIGVVSFVAMSVFMTLQAFHAWYQYTFLLCVCRNQWIVAMAIGCVFYLYSTFRLCYIYKD